MTCMLIFHNCHSMSGCCCRSSGSLLLPAVEACRKACFQWVALESLFLSENFQRQNIFLSPNKSLEVSGMLA
jgi:hypothetical protein